jgi:hypothetical protein
VDVRAVAILLALGLALPAAAAGKQTSDRLPGLREACYGGRRGAPLSRQAIEIRERQIAAALRAHDAERVFRLTRRLLQGGADERRLLPGFVAAIEGAGGPDSKGHAAICTELLEALPAPDKG